MKAKVRGTEIYFDITGMQHAPHKNKLIERPVLFLLHGGPGGDHTRFKFTSTTLQEVAQLVFIDHRGCGRSKKTKAAHYTLENNIEDIEALRQHLGLERISLLGVSYGGIVAQGYAIRYPQHVEKLILAVTTPSYHCFNDAKKLLATHGTPTQIKAAERLWDGTFKNQRQLGDFFKVMETMYSHKAKKSRQTNTVPSTTQWSHEALNMGFGGFLRKLNYIPQLKKITCPTLVIGAEHDWICPPKHSKVIADHIPNAKLIIVKNSGHSITVDANTQYLQAIKNFLRKTHAGKRKSRRKN